jgi:hypothetical protein
MLKKMLFILLLGACTQNTAQNTPTSSNPTDSSQEITPSSSPSALIDASPLPTMDSQASGSPQIVTTPTPTPGPIITAIPSIIPSNLPSMAPSPTALMIPGYKGVCPTVDEIAIVQKTSLNGEVVDENGIGVSGVTINLRSLDPCRVYSAEVETNNLGKYAMANVPYNHSIEIEVATPYQPSVFYQTRIRPNPAGNPETNYFPFRIKRKQLPNCIAIAPSDVDVSGKILLDNSNLLSNSEALVQIRSVDGCNSFNKKTQTQNQQYFFSVPTIGGAGQLTLSFAGRATEVRTITVNSNKQGLPDVNIYDIEIDSSPNVWKELDPVWIPGRLYPWGAPDS